MVLLSIVDGKERIVRDVAYMQVVQHIEGFLALRHYHKNGKLYQLKGKERRLLRSFGSLEIK